MVFTMSPGDLPVFLVILEQNSPRSVHLGTIESSGTELLDVDEGWFETPFRECLAIIREDEWKPIPSRMRVFSRDGQVFPGSFMSGDEDSITIRHPWMREMRIPLDDVDRVEFRSSDTSITDTDQDHLLLRNGDVMSGFIEMISDPVTIEVTRDEVEMFDVPLERIAEIRLAGDSKPPRWPRAWFIDGLQATVPSIEVDDTGHVRMAPHEFMTGPYERYPGIEEMVAIVMDGDRFTPLSSADVRTVAIDPVRRVNPDPRKLDVMKVFNLSDLRISGPVQHEFTVTRGFNRFRTVLERPRNSDRWASPDVEIKVGDDVIWSGPVVGRVPIDLELPQSCESLVIRVECGEHGPVQCGVILRDPIISKQSTVGDGRQLLE
ncbi:MAG: hypothetical protein CMJ40_09015 [Phycisphaerae bacterium]|nr:hypothetical protein [Phycisphaerae bacterium]